MRLRDVLALLCSSVLDLPAADDHTEDSPLVIVTGWGEGLLGWRKSATLINQRTGRRVVVVTAPGWSNLRLRFSRGSSLERVAEHIVATLKQLGVTNAVGLGHSLGGYALALADSLDPSLFSELVFVCSGGFMDHDRWWFIAGRLTKKTVFSVWDAFRRPKLLLPTFIALFEGLWYGARNPMSLTEAFQIGAARTSDILRANAKRRIVYGAVDPLFPPARQVARADRILEGIGHDPQYGTDAFVRFVIEYVFGV